MRALLSAFGLISVLVGACAAESTTAPTVLDAGSRAMSDAASSPRDAATADDSGEACGCLLGEGRYCGARAVALAAATGCTIGAATGHADDLLECKGGAWSLAAECNGECAYDAAELELGDACVLPACECFVEEAWCGSGAARKAATLGCQIPIAQEHSGDILYCPGGVWSVKQACELGCSEAPEGTPDVCKSDSEYRLPVACGSAARCTNGNQTSTHTGKDRYAFDFGMPIGTEVRAMRGGTVLRVRNVSPPGSACHEAGSTGCANYANTVEIEHSDGTVGLYMHLSVPRIATGVAVARGALLGLSGNSGWSTGPHTHVQIQQNCGIWWCQSLPFQFAEASSPGKGDQIESANCPP